MISYVIKSDQSKGRGICVCFLCGQLRSNNSNIIISNNNNLLQNKQAGMCYCRCRCRSSALGLFCVCFVTLLCLPASGNSVESLPFNPHSQEQLPQQTTGNGYGNGSIPAQQQSVIVETTTTRKESCEVNVPEQLSPAAVALACGTLDRERCCPVLAAWVYAARASALMPSPAPEAPPPGTAMMPAVPEDAGACAGAVERALAGRGVQLPRANDSCDAVQCVCGIHAGVRRLSWSSCSNVSPRHLHRLQHDCHAHAHARDQGQGQVGISCSACLRSLRQLSGNDVRTMQQVRSSGSGMEENGERMIIVRRRECELMGLTWLLGRNSSAYISTVAAVLRTTMYNSLVATTHGADSYDGTTCFAGAADRRSMPLPVDSSQLGQSQSSASAASEYTVSLGAAAAAILASGFFSILFRFQVI